MKEELRSVAVVKNPRTGGTLPTIHIQVGDLVLSSSGGGYCVLVSDEDEIGAAEGRHYVVAHIEVDRDGCDVRTVGTRPWTAKVPANDIFEFCFRAVGLIDALINKDETRD